MFQPGLIIPLNDVSYYSYPMDDRRSRTGSFELLAISGRSEVVNYSQEVTLRHVFLNNTGSTCEATFQFPLERGCAVTGFSADVNGRHIEGKIEEKEKAEEMYDDAIASGSSAYMAQQVKDDTALNFSLGNVEKDAEFVISVSYLAELNVEGEKISVPIGPKGVVQFSRQPVKTTGFVNGFSYEVHVVNSVGISAEETERTDYRCVMNESGTEALYTIAHGVKDCKPLDNLTIALSEPHRTCVSVQQLPTDTNKFVSLTLFPKIEGEMKSEMIFLIDCSGSMSGSLIERAKNTLQFFLRSMQEGLIFNIVCFGSTFRALFRRSVPYNDKTLAEATVLVDEIQATMGGTELYHPLKYIFDLPEVKGYPRQVFLMTDGEVVNPDACISLVRENAHNTRVFTFGIGSGADAALCQDTAKAGNGVCVMIRETKDMREMVMKQLGFALSPSISDITVEWDDRIQQAPAQLKPVFDGTILNIYGLIPEEVRKGKHIVTVLGRTERDKDGEKSFREVIEFNTEAVLPGSSMIKAAVKKLLDDLKDEKQTVSLSTKYGVLHKSTAFVAVGPVLKDPSTGEVKMEKLEITRSTPYKAHPSTHLVGFGTPIPSCSYSYSGGVGAHPPSCSYSYSGGRRSHQHGAKSKRRTERKECERGSRKKREMVFYEVAPEEDYEDEEEECDRLEFREDDCDYSDDDYESGVSYFCDTRPAMVDPLEKRRAYRDPGKRAKSSPQGSKLDQIIKHQAANGVFGKDVLKLIGVPLNDLVLNKPSAPGIDEEEALELWITVVVLQYLETKEASHKSEWEVVVKKSHKRLGSKLSPELLALWKEAANSLLSSF